MNRFLLVAACAVLMTAARAQDDVKLSSGHSEHIKADWPVKGAALTDPTIADVQVLEPRLVLVSGKAAGVTDLLLWGENGETRTLRVEVTQDLSTVESDLANLVPGAQLSIESHGGTTIVSGRLLRAEQVQSLHTYFDARKLPWVDATSVAGPQQVSVQVRLAEVSRTGLRQLGMNVLKGGSSFFGGLTTGSSNGGPIQPISIGAGLGATALGDVPFTFTAPVVVSPGVSLFAGFPKADLEYFLQALSENEYLRILAEPNLVALSGEEARFLAGGEFPIPVVQGGGTSGGTSVTIEYKQFGVSLRFKPMVLGDGTIRLRVFSEVSDLSDQGAVEIQGFQVPAIVTRNAETTIEVKSGQTFALAGLLSHRVNGRVSQIPGLGDLPILGTLFRSTRYTSGETELLLLATTSLVEPLSTNELPPLPGENQVEPNDWELFFDGKMETDRIAPPKDSGSDWMRAQGLADLAGPGGWTRHGQAAAESRARPEELALAGSGNFIGPPAPGGATTEAGTP
jgi:pilus assembly protein CpaC